MKTYPLLLLTIIIVWGLMSINGLIIPIQKIPLVQDPLVIVLKDLGCPDKQLVEISKALYLAGEQTDISPYLLAVLAKTESSFNKKAISYKHYKGLMQTPTATMQFEDVDILHGARILQQKLKLADGNLLQALSFYKGKRGSSLAKEQAKEVLAIYNKIRVKNLG